MMLPAEVYLAHLRADAARFVTAVRAAGWDAAVPTCPEWDVRELTRHVGAVYWHKVACIRLGRRPAEDDYSRDPAPGAAVLDWLHEGLATLLAELEQRGPDAPAYTWQPADQTVGFWYRRMAQETVVHRLDAELAASTPTPVDGELALDGVDEVLRVFLVGPWWEREPVAEATGRTVAVRSGGAEWRVTLEPAAVRVAGADGEAPVAGTVEAAPYDALMWAWGRPTDGPVHASGDPSAVAELRARLALVT